eukprot:CAMPEP_0113879498 /NCGR_PEP_ID=MMETSP0780_2-20120614/7271_1 /TAXON_ID=652834 /ORGANISM="Palpitomonas bilix" /LENGTH=257 /DNA_ID=CAMNT_0000866085 /DNA_START=152 /DNA_END=925 /DNA_ORIENTATION=+ /assembly_acc=CAM_ASM_000599
MSSRFHPSGDYDSDSDENENPARPRVSEVPEVALPTKSNTDTFDRFSIPTNAKVVSREEHEKHSGFVLTVSGQLQSGEFPGWESLYCHYNFVMGPDWSITDGLEEGYTQVATRSVSASSEDELVWNFPISITFKSTNAFGWPQIVLRVYGFDHFNRQVIRGYSAAHLPSIAGQHRLKLRCFRPMASSKMMEFQGWMAGQRPEFVDDDLPAKADGRKACRVRSRGHIALQLNVATRFMKEFGYSEEPRGTHAQSVTHL